MWLNSITSITLGLSLVYAGIVVVFFFWQDKFLYFPQYGGTKDTPAQIGLDYESLSLMSEDGVRLHGWYVPTNNARGSLLFFHGNAGDISLRLDSIRLFHELDLNVLIIDYRGYGKSQGKPSEHGTYRDARAAWRYLVDTKAVAPSKIILFGRSLGGAVAAQLASEQRPAALILESSFSSVPDLGAQLYPYLPVRWLARQRYATRDKLADLSCPVLIIHGRNDTIIPPSHAHTLYQAAQEPKQQLILRGGHNDALFADPQGYRNGLNDFLRCHLEQPSCPE